MLVAHQLIAGEGEFILGYTTAFQRRADQCPVQCRGPTQLRIYSRCKIPAEKAPLTSDQR
jgi:hypothetical protein